MSDLATALMVAVKVHAAQTDKQGEPYLLHVLRVAEAVSDRAKVVAALHDVLEDSSLTVADLNSKDIGTAYTDALIDLTRGEEPYVDYIERVATSGNPIAVEVKLADVCDNLARIPSQPSPGGPDTRLRAQAERDQWGAKWASLKARYEDAIGTLAAVASSPVPPTGAQWSWHGMAGHFVCADRCCFHLHTVVGEYRISSVGCYHPSGDESGKPHTIGRGRLFETMVFRVDDPGPSNEIDFEGYNTAEDADRGHLRLCLKYAAAPVSVGDEDGICGVICNCGPNGEPMACAFSPGHEDDHSWASLPTWTKRWRIVHKPPRLSKNRKRVLEEGSMAIEGPDTEGSIVVYGVAMDRGVPAHERGGERG